MSKPNYLALSFIVLLLSCNKDKIIGTPSGSTTPIPTPTTQVGIFTIEPTKEIISKEITTNGGIVAVENTKTDLDGLKIEVPAQAYATPVTFKISASKIVKNELGADINIISPLIEIDNGGEYANDIMTLTIPIKVPQGHFASAFMYNRDNGEMEVLPILSLESDKIVVATTHFNSSNVVKNGKVGDLKKGSVVVHSIDEKTLENFEYDTGFQAKVDNWEFANYGTSVSLNGNCSGMTLSALYYFKNIKGKTNPLPLWKAYQGVFVNNKTESDSIWFDNKFGLRLVSVAQKSSQKLLPKIFLKTIERKLSNKVRFDTEQYKNLITHFKSNSSKSKAFPAYLHIQPIDNIDKTNHVILCVGVRKNEIIVCDPNLPNKTYSIQYTPNEGFKSYKTVYGKTKREYEPMFFIMSSFLVDLDISKEFEKKNAEDVGSDLFGFKKLSFFVENEKRELINGISLFDNAFIFLPTCGECSNEFYSKNGERLSDTNPLKKLSGINTIGIFVLKDNSYTKWVDFQWFDINIEKLEIKSLEGEDTFIKGMFGKEYTFIADGTYKPTAKSIYTWNFGDGSKDIKVTGNNQVKYTYKTRGDYAITMTLADEKGELTTITRQTTMRDELPSIPNDLSKVVNSEFITYLKSKGMVINEGNNPPAIDGYFTINPNEFVNYLNLPKEKIEDAVKTFKTYTFQFSKYDKQAKSVLVSSYRYGEGYSIGEQVLALGNGFVMGSGNKFTVYANHHIVLNVPNYMILRTTSIYSGELTTNGISNFMQAFVITSREIDAGKRSLEVNTGRITKDKDGFSEKVNGLQSTYEPSLIMMYLWWQ